MALPASIFLKSNKNSNFLRYRKEDDSNHACLQFTQHELDENCEISCIKFEVQMSVTAQCFVHIRNCYNHKYWVRKSADSKSIVAEANEPEEDQSKWSCTLFKAVLIDDGSVEGTTVDADNLHPKPQKIRLVHADQFGQQECALSGTDLVIGDIQGPRTNDVVFFAYNAASLCILPNVGAFMASTEKYCAPTSIRQYAIESVLMDFKTTDIGDEGVPHHFQQIISVQPQYMVVHNGTGTSVTHYNRWVTGEPYSPTIKDTLVTLLGRGATYFTPIGLDGNRIALRLWDDSNSTLLNRFANCIPVNLRGVDNVLGGTATSINQSAIFQVVEPVLRRDVRNVVFSARNARIYNVREVEKFTDTRSNHTSVEQTGVFRVSYSTSETRIFNDIVTVTRSVQASWSSQIPFVGETGVHLSTERVHTVEWGTEINNESKIEYEQSITIPPRKRVTLLVVTNKAECDVPFTCQVTDTFTDGNTSTYTQRQGMFIGANEYSSEMKMIETDL